MNWAFPIVRRYQRYWLAMYRCSIPVPHLPATAPNLARVLGATSPDELPTARSRHANQYRAGAVDLSSCCCGIGHAGPAYDAVHQMQ